MNIDASRLTRRSKSGRQVAAQAITIARHTSAGFAYATAVNESVHRINDLFMRSSWTKVGSHM